MAEKVVVVGGGVFGATGALELRRRGYGVTLLDRGPLPHPAASSTDISKVIRMDYGSDEFYMTLMEGALEGWRDWNERPPRPLFHEVGFVILTHQEMRPGSFEGDSFRLLRARGHEPQRVGPREIAERFPNWAHGGYLDGYFNPVGGWAESGAVVAQLLDRCRQANVVILEGAPVSDLLVAGGRVRGVRTGEIEHRADWVVLAAGAWTSGLLSELADKVWPVAQPVVHFQVQNPPQFGPPAFPPWASDVATSGWYGFPALDDGTVKMANHGPGWRRPPSGEAELPAEVEGRFRSFLRANLPALAEARRSGSRMCFYADSWDGDLYIDRVPGRPGLVVATGGSGHGFKLAPLLGGIIADALEGIESPASDRFGWRDRGERRTEEARYT